MSDLLISLREQATEWNDRQREDMSGLTEADKARFNAKVDRCGEDECWPWLGAKSGPTLQKQYGQFWLNGKKRKASQIAWQIFHAEEFPAGKMACHSCDNPRCVNPRHIWPGTMSENIKDCVAKGRHFAPDTGRAPRHKTHCVNGHEYTEANTKWNSAGRKFCRICDVAAKRKWQQEKQTAHRAAKRARAALAGKAGT